MSALRWVLAAVLGLAIGAAFAPASAQSAATLTHAAGTVYVQSADGVVRPAVVGAGVAGAETVTTDRESYAKLTFSDGAEILLRPSSRVRVQRYGYVVPVPEEDNFALELLKGGMRAVTGLLGGRSAERWKVATPTSTIGIRGTVFDALLCQQDCTGGADGLYTAAIEAAHTHTNETGTFVVEETQSVYVRDARTRPEVLPMRCGFTFPGDLERAPLMQRPAAPDCVLR